MGPRCCSPSKLKSMKLFNLYAKRVLRSSTFASCKLSGGVHLVRTEEAGVASFNIPDPLRSVSWPTVRRVCRDCALEPGHGRTGAPLAARTPSELIQPKSSASSIGSTIASWAMRRPKQHAWGSSSVRLQQGISNKWLGCAGAFLKAVLLLFQPGSSWSGCWCRSQNGPLSPTSTVRGTLCSPRDLAKEHKSLCYQRPFIPLRRAVRITPATGSTREESFTVQHRTRRRTLAHTSAVEEKSNARRSLDFMHRPIRLRRTSG
jgi:hypothetical protein